MYEHLNKYFGVNVTLKFKFAYATVINGYVAKSSTRVALTVTSVVCIKKYKALRNFLEVNQIR